MAERRRRTWGRPTILAGVDAALAAGQERGAEAVALDVLSQLRAWDGRVDDRPVVTLYHLFEDILWRRTFFDEMGDPLFSRFYEWAGAERPAGLVCDPRRPDVALVRRHRHA